MPREKKSFFLYSIGRHPDVLSLGTLLLGDYANPTLAHNYKHPLLSDEERSKWVSTSELGPCRIDAKSSSNARVGIDAAEFFKFDPHWTSTNNKILVAKSGVRTELKDPDEFLATAVLPPGSKGRQALKIWISATQVDYILKLKWVRSPKVWMLTGQYIFEHASSTTVVGNELGATVGISSEAMAALTAVPLGFSFKVDEKTSLKVDMKLDKDHVWAAQWRLLDLKYLKATEEKESKLPNAIAFSDSVCAGHLRDSTDFNNAVSVGLAPDEEDDAQNSENKKQEELYNMAVLDKAIEDVSSFENED